MIGVFSMMKFIQQFIGFLRDIIGSWRIILELTSNDFQLRYMGSYLGMLWAFVQPIVTVMIFWFVFELGFKSMPVDNFPFILWLMSGMFPWFFFSEGLANATNAIIDNGHLVKKVVFRVSVLPIIKILSALFIHIFFIVFLMGMFWTYGYAFSIYNIQILYYLFASIVLLLGLSWFTSSLIVFVRDTGQIIAMFIQFGFWLTPIFWSLKIIPLKYHSILQLNPMYYIVEGYRNSFIYHIWFWEDINMTIYFWSITLILFICGAVMFKKLRPHFADVL